VKHAEFEDKIFIANRGNAKEFFCQKTAKGIS